MADLDWHRPQRPCTHGRLLRGISAFPLCTETSSCIAQGTTSSVPLGIGTTPTLSAAMSPIMNHTATLPMYLHVSIANSTTRNAA